MGSIVVTGASTGIGRAIASALEAAGHTVFAGVRSDADADAIRAVGSPRLLPLRIDVTSADSIRAAASAVDAALGNEPLLALVNNAGIGLGGPLEFLAIDDLRRQLEVNVIGQIAVTQSLLPAIRRGTAGRIVFMGSIGGRISQPLMGPYCASKFALRALSDALRQELAPFGIRVALVEPGAIQTPIWSKSGDELTRSRSSYSDAALAHYGDAVERFGRGLARNASIAIPAEVVANVVRDLIASSRPRPRTLVGTDARIGAVLRWLLPDRVFDWVLRRA